MISFIDVDQGVSQDEDHRQRRGAIYEQGYTQQHRTKEKPFEVQQSKGWFGVGEIKKHVRVL